MQYSEPLVKQATDAYDEHEFKLKTDLVPYCKCGWTAGRPLDVGGYNRHVAVAILDAVYEDIREQAQSDALRDADYDMAMGGGQ